MKSLNYLVTLALVALAFVSCGKETKTAGTEAERVEKVRTQKMEASTISRKASLSSVLQGYETLNVAPSVTGKIEHIYVEEGSRVKSGDNLVRMDQLQYNTAKLAFANLGTELTRVEALLETGSATQQAYDQLKLSYDQTKENLEFLKQNTYFTAPFSGVIAYKAYEDGELFAGQPILILTQISKLKAEIAVPESYFPLVKEGMNLDIHSDIYGDKVFKGTIETVFPTIDPASHTFMIKVRIPNASEELRPGMYINSVLYLGEVETIVVPYQAVLKLQGSDNRYVFVNENGRAKRIDVELGQRFDDKVEIISKEISAGDDLIVVGQSRLVDGVKLEVVAE